MKAPDISEGWRFCILVLETEFLKCSFLACSRNCRMIFLRSIYARPVVGPHPVGIHDAGLGRAREMYLTILWPEEPLQRTMPILRRANSILQAISAPK